MVKVGYPRAGVTASRRTGGGLLWRFTGKAKASQTKVGLMQAGNVQETALDWMEFYRGLWRMTDKKEGQRQKQIPFENDKQEKRGQRRGKAGVVLIVLAFSLPVLVRLLRL
jgi:hypothetical protein